MANAATLFLLALAGGFLFAYNCHYTSYLASRVQGQALLLLTACYAVGLLFLSRLTLTMLEWLYRGDTSLILIRCGWEALAGPLDIPALPTFVGAFFYAPILAWVANEAYDADEASDRVIREYGGDAEKLLSRYLSNVELVSVTLDNRKVYIGWPTYTPGLRRDAEDFRLLPALSGYRDEKTLKLGYTTYYVDILDKIEEGELKGTDTEVLDARDLEIVIPLERVASLGPFSLDIPQEEFRLPTKYSET